MSQIVEETPESLAARAGVAVEDLRELARALAGAPAATLLYDEMATGEPSGASLAEDVLQLALLTENYGRPGAGAGPLFEDANSLGARDMGLLPETLPGYAPVHDATARARFAHLWGGSEPSADAGLDYAAMTAGGVKALYVMGADPARHTDPTAIERLDFLVVQDLFMTETARRADVVLPAVAYTEKDGSFTNTERCVQAVRRAMRPLPGARADWEILVGIAQALGADWRYRSPADILAEIGQAVPLYGGLTRAALGTSGVRWPLAMMDGDGAATLVGSDHLTWDHLRDGAARGMRPSAPTPAGGGGADV